MCCPYKTKRTAFIYFSTLGINILPNYAAFSQTKLETCVPINNTILSRPCSKNFVICTPFITMNILHAWTCTIPVHTHDVYVHHCMAYSLQQSYSYSTNMRPFRRRNPLQYNAHLAVIDSLNKPGNKHYNITMHKNVSVFYAMYIHWVTLSFVNTEV